MSLYRRVSIRIYGDEKFKALSAPKPNAQTLMLYLITGPQTGQIPGLSVAGEASLSEALGWSVGAFRRCYAEIASLGMAIADWRARLLYLPNSKKHNAPRNIQMVKGWREAFNDLPDCALRDAAFSDFHDYLASPVFKPELVEPFSTPLTHKPTRPSTDRLTERLTLRQTLPSSGSSSGMSKSSGSLTTSRSRGSRPPNPEIGQFITTYHDAFLKRTGEKPNITGKEARLAQQLVTRHGLEKATEVMARMFESPDPFIVQSGRTLGVLSSQWNKLVVGTNGRHGPRAINDPWAGKTEPREVKLK